MSWKTITYNRNTINKQVWERPVVHVAKDYGLSDNGLRKVCKKLKVPLPKAGHWAKVQHGHKVKKTLFPKDTGPEEVSSQSWVEEGLEDSEKYESESIFAQLIVAEKLADIRMEVDHNEEEFLPVVRKTLRSLRSGRSKDRNLCGLLPNDVLIFR